MKRPLSPEEIARIQQAARAANFYEQLSVPQEADRSTIDSAYRAFVREWHPDRFFSRDVGTFQGQIETNFVEATRAYETLKDERKRKDYDRGLQERGQWRERVSRQSMPPTPPPAPPAPEVPGYEVSLGGPVKQTVAPAPVAPRPMPARPAPPAAMAAAVAHLRQQQADQQAKINLYLQQAQADIAAGRPVKAESNLYLAQKLAPQNKEIAALLLKVSDDSKVHRANALIAQAEQDAQYGRPKEALACLQRAADVDAPDGRAFFMLARARKAAGENDTPKELLQLYKKAALRSPKNFEYRLMLAEAYEQLGMTANAHREALVAVELDPKNDPAKQLAKRTRA